ncbi:MAG: zinc ribbon domain-containing protein [Gemmatimonadetes bacterium]|nr:zinc ribbon domain-containing protein [Gemmatimonadota bacterium]
MTPDTSALLSRFHRALVREIREVRPDYLVEPFTVAEIYQNLVPYRSHRDVIGVEMNGDYEDALLRLLAGEGDYLFLESEMARREIREELQTGNPNTGLFRDFAAADVRLNPSKIDFDGPVLYEESNADDVGKAEVVYEDSDLIHEPEEFDGTNAVSVNVPEAENDAADDPELAFGFTETDDVVADPAADTEGHAAEPSDDGPGMGEVEASNPVASDGAATSSCPWCKEELPEREGIKFCPFCGSNLGFAPCTACGEDIDTGWRFCIACGTEAPS